MTHRDGRSSRDGRVASRWTRWLWACWLWAMGAAVAATTAGAVAAPPANAADLYRQAFRWLDEARESGILTREEDNSLQSGPSPNSASGSDASGRVRPYIALLRNAASAPRCDWGIDRRRGYLASMPHLARLREAARHLRTDAQLRMQAGDVDGAIESLVAMANFADHARVDGIVVSSLVGAAILSLQDRVVDEALGVDGFTAEAAASLLRGLKPFEGQDPLRLRDALDGDAELLRATFALEGDDLAKGYEALTASASEEVDLDGLAGQLPQANRAFADLREALEGPDREAIAARVAEVTAKIQAGEYGDLAKLGTPLSLGHALTVSWRIEDAIAARTATLRALRDGTMSPASLANAAYAYLLLARLGEGRSVEIESEIEAARVAHAALDPETQERVRAHLAPGRLEIAAAFGRAARCGRCDFAIAGQPGPSFLPHYLRGLRAAFRLQLADALLGAGARVDDTPPPSAESAIATGIRLAGHLASDPRLGHSLVATTILLEAADGLDAALARGLLDAAAAKRLSELLDGLSRTDPLGFRGAVDREIARLRERGADELHASRDPTSLAMYLLVLQMADDAYDDALGPIELRAADAPLPPAWRDERLTEPLSGIADLANPASTAAARTALLAWRAETHRLSERAQRTGDWTRFKRQPLRYEPAPCDATSLANSAGEIVVRMDDALRAAAMKAQ